MIGTNFSFNTLKTSGLPKNSLNFVFLGDGFASDATSQGMFNAACLDKMNAILAQDPWKSKAYNLNFYSINVPSAQNGISHAHTAPDCPALTIQPVYKNASYFGLAFDSLNVHRFVLPTTAQAQLIQATIIASMPGIATATNITQNFVPIVICNDANYGGSEWGAIAVTTLNTQSDEVLLHELGHCVGGLNDEYSGGSKMEAWNTTMNNNLATIRWANLEPQGAGAILYEAGMYKAFSNCKMNTLNQPYCLVCYNQIVKAINQLITMSGGTPATAPINPPPSAPTGLTTAGNDSISLSCNDISGATQYTFTMNTGTKASASIPSITFTALSPKTTYSVTVTVTTANGTSPASLPFTFTTP